MIVNLGGKERRELAFGERLIFRQRLSVRDLSFSLSKMLNLVKRRKDLHLPNRPSNLRP